MSGYMDECTVAVNDDLSADIAVDCASIEYGDFHVDDASFARLASARPRRQKPACEHVLKSWCFTASASAASTRSAHSSNMWQSWSPSGFDLSINVEQAFDTPWFMYRLFSHFFTSKFLYIDSSILTRAHNIRGLLKSLVETPSAST